MTIKNMYFVVYTVLSELFIKKQKIIEHNELKHNWPRTRKAF